MSDENQFKRFVILLDKIDGADATEQDVKGHIEFLRTLDKNKQLVFGGPFTDHNGGMIIIKANSLEEAKATAESDPLVSRKLRSCEVRTWVLSCEENNHLGRG